MTDLESRAYIKRDKPFPHYAPADIHAEARMAEVKDGQEVLMREWRPRNVKQHRRLFAILHQVVKTSDKWQDEDELLDAIKLATGLAVLRQDLDGVIYRVPKSISFASMPAPAFERFYKRATYVLSQILGVDVETLLNETKQDDRRRA